jgi:hypothetical protein
VDGISTYEPPEENLLSDAHIKCGMVDFKSTDYKKSEVMVTVFLTLSI